MGKEGWILTIAITHLEELLEEAGKLSTFNLLMEWRHFVKHKHFAKKRNAKEVNVLKKFVSDIRPRFPHNELAGVYRAVLAFFAWLYAQKVSR